jgi:hypothetical protein
MDVIVQGQSSSCVCPVKGSGFTGGQNIVKPTVAAENSLSKRGEILTTDGHGFFCRSRGNETHFNAE